MFRKLILAGAMLATVGVTPRARAAILLSDAFDYTNGALVVVSSNWVHHSGNVTGEVQVVSSRVLFSQTNTEDVSALLAGQPYSSSSTNQLYASFTVNFAAPPSGSGSYFAHFKDGGTGFRDRVFATTNGAPANTYRVGLTNSATSSLVLLSSNLSLNTDYTLVTRYTPSNAACALWLNPAAETDPGVTGSEPGTIAVAAFALREAVASGNGMGTLYLDNLLIATSFGEVLTNVPPSITTQPQSQTVTAGANVTFSVVASGSAPLSYQWQVNGTNQPNATNSIFTLTNVSTNQAGGYSVTVTNLAGATNSQTAILTVLPATAPTIITNPQSQTVTAGETASFSVTASGTPPLQYQWQFNGTNLLDATNATLNLVSVTTNQAGSYLVTVTNVAGSTNSQPATLTVTPPPPQLTNFSVLTYNVKGNGVTNTDDWSTNAPQVKAIGRELMYLHPDIITFNEIPYGSTWQMTNWVAAFLPGYSLATNSGTDGFIRSVIASRFPITRSQKWLDGVSLAPFGYSGNFTRDLFEAQISVPNVSQPLHVFVAHLKATTGSTLAARNDDAAKRAAEASAVSNFFVATFLPGTNGQHPYILNGDMNEDIIRPGTNYTTQQPIQRLVSPPTGLQLTTPLNPFTLSDLTESIQATELTVRFDYILPCAAMFSNIVSSQVFRTGQLTNPPAPLLTNDDRTASDHLPVLMVFSGNAYAPLVTSPPVDQVAQLSSNAVFSVSATGTAPLRYQWYSGSTPTPGETNSSLTLSHVGFPQAGTYSVVITNLFGRATGGPVSLVVTDTIPPTITSCASNLVLSTGSGSETALPDLTGQVSGSDASGSVFVTQTPPPGTLAAPGLVNLTFSVQDSTGNAAFCQASVTVVQPPFLSTSAVSNGNYTFSFASDSNLTYSVEYKLNLTDSTWLPLMDFAGTGSPITVADGVTNASKFYRVRVH